MEKMPFSTAVRRMTQTKSNVEGGKRTLGLIPMKILVQRVIPSAWEEPKALEPPGASWLLLRKSVSLADHPCNNVELTFHQARKLRHNSTKSSKSDHFWTLKSQSQAPQATE
jgi:hypothetical protein